MIDPDTMQVVILVEDGCVIDELTSSDSINVEVIDLDHIYDWSVSDIVRKISYLKERLPPSMLSGIIPRLEKAAKAVSDMNTADEAPAQSGSDVGSSATADVLDIRSVLRNLSTEESSGPVT